MSIREELKKPISEQSDKIKILSKKLEGMNDAEIDTYLKVYSYFDDNHRVDLK